MARLIGIFGGTFDPVHAGHVTMALRLLQALPLEKIIFVPNRTPPHRPLPHFSAVERLQLIQQAIQSHPRLEVSDLELQQNAVSYTIDTLHALRQQYPDAVLCLIMGEDNLYTLNQWHCWQELFTIAHLIVLDRPSHLPAQTPPWLHELLTIRASTNPDDLVSEDSGRIFLFHTEPINLSSTQLRQQSGR